MDIKSGMTAVVTGGGSGIGRSIVLALADAGVNVVVADLDDTTAGVVAEEVTNRGVGALAHKVDVASLDSVRALADAAYDRFGSVQILVNNAGVTLQPFRSTWDASYEDFQWMMGVNFWGVHHGHFVFVPRMIEQGGPAHIVNTSSMSTASLPPGLASFTAAKSAVEALSLTARAEFATAGIPISVSVLQPGATRTSIFTTEKRLRGGGQKAAVRDVKPWSDYVEGPVGFGMTRDQDVPDPDVPTQGMYEFVTPNATGHIVLNAIGQDLEYALTHPPHRDAFDERTASILAGAPDYTGYESKS